ncbi:MAG: pseudouridine synthase [Comamonadaceae bacterium]|nr:pseudouridine synthase [Comamonadaceae bacterium]
MLLPLLWHDPHLVALYKPAGWLVHRTGLDAGETRFVVQTLRAQLGQRVYPVHRLDKGTCGVLLMALHPEAARRLCAAFAQQQVHKRYLACVRGWAPEDCTVDHALRPDDAPPDAPAQPARTRFTRLAQLELAQASDARYASTRASLVLAQPQTGRRHQVRRHCKHIAHPILGDATHGKGPLNRWWAQQLGHQRLWLHAWQLDLAHPMTGAPLRLHSGLHCAPASAASTAVPATAPITVPAPHTDLQHWQQLLLQPWQWAPRPA